MKSNISSIGKTMACKTKSMISKKAVSATRKAPLSLKGRRVVVTGAGGFIGSHLVEGLLAQGAFVKALVRYNSRSDIGFLKDIPRSANNRLEIVLGNVEDSNAVIRLLEGADYVFHLAALIGIPYSYEAPQSYISTNVTGTLNVLEAARMHHIKRILITSTSEVYGTAMKTPMDESHPLQPQSPYSATKISADMLAGSFARSFGLPVVIVRPFNTFGPRQSMRAVIPTIMVQCLRGNETRLGDLTPVRDLNYVGNTVDGFIACALRGVPDGRAYNLASGEGHSIKEVVQEIFKLSGRKGKILQEEGRFRPEYSEVRVLIGDSSRAQAELEWSPKVTFKEGLKKTFNWVKNNLSIFPSEKNYTR